MPKSQSFKTHARIDPAHHPAIFILLLNVIVAIVWAFVSHSPGVPLRMWIVIVSIALLISSMKARTNSLKVQDRIIRLEEQVRYAALLPPETLATAATLPIGSMIALRFASDAELPMLLQAAAQENLTRAQIKARITDWRPDHHRV